MGDFPFECQIGIMYLPKRETGKSRAIKKHGAIPRHVQPGRGENSPHRPPPSVNKIFPDQVLMDWASVLLPNGVHGKGVRAKVRSA